MIGIKNEILHEDLIKLKYTNCCIKETLRLWGPAALINRNVNTDIETDSIKIPAGCRIIVLKTSFNFRLDIDIYTFKTSPRSSSRSEEYFEDPLAFKPERFMRCDDEDKKLTKLI